MANGMFEELLASGQVPPEILQQMEAARDPRAARMRSGGFVQRGNEPPMAIPGMMPQQPSQVDPATAPQMGQFQEFRPGPVNPTYADLYADNPEMGQAYLRSRGVPGHLQLGQVPLQGEDRKRYEDAEKRRFDYWKSRKDIEAAELARKREARLAAEGAARDKAADARMKRLEEGRPLTTVELRDVRKDIENMDSANLALTLLEGKNVKGMVGDKEATGWKGFVPDVILQRADPMGVDTRAALSNIGSLRAQERSGGAIPAHEWERIKGFIPTDTDDSRTARKKLRQFLDEYRRALRATMSTFEGRKIPQGLRKEIEGRAGRPPLGEIFDAQRD